MISLVEKRAVNSQRFCTAVVASSEVAVVAIAGRFATSIGYLARGHICSIASGVPARRMRTRQEARVRSSDREDLMTWPFHPSDLAEKRVLRSRAPTAPKRRQEHCLFVHSFQLRQKPSLLHMPNASVLRAEPRSSDSKCMPEVVSSTDRDVNANLRTTTSQHGHTRVNARPL